MAIETFHITKGDLSPPYRFKVVDSYNRPVGLAGATIYCTMISGGGVVKINNSTTGISITDEAAGEGEYQWQAGDTEVAGFFQIEFKVKLSGDGTFTVPREADGEAYVLISHRLGG